MAVCLCVIVRAGYGHVSWFILGLVPLLLGKTWIWSKVSNYSFCNYLRNVIGEDTVCVFGAWDGVCRRLRVPVAFALSTWAPAAGRVPPACRSKAHPEQGEAISPPLFLHWSGWRVELALPLPVPSGLRLPPTAPIQGPGILESFLPRLRPLLLPPAFPAIPVLSPALDPVPRWESARLDSGDPRSLRD